MRRTLLHFGLALASLALIGCQSSPSEQATTQPATKPSRARAPKGVMEHRRDAFDAEMLRDGSFHHVTYDDANVPQLRLRDPQPDYPSVGTWTSSTIKTNFKFTELLPSWNVMVPAETGVRFDVRVRDAESEAWSPWLYIGYWGRVLRNGRVLKFDGGKVDVDTLVLTRPADAYEIRATLQDFDDRESSTPLVRAINVVYSRAMPADKKDRAEPRNFAATMPATRSTSRPTMSLAAKTPSAVTKPKKVPTTLPASIDIPVPYRAQGWEVDSIRHSVCSPTSVSMLLEWAGRPVATEECSRAIWDDDNAMFGNWNRAVQYAGSLGFEAYLERFSSMDEARALLSTGQPIIASIRFEKGEFPSNVQTATAGHLIVLRGYTESGDIIVNDPASKDQGNGAIYKADELANAWLVSTGGVGYVIKKK